jgi:hypothetical protein
MARTLNDVLRIMRLAISRRNPNDPDSTDAVLIGHVNDFISLTMSDDIRMFEQQGTLRFLIDETATDGVYTFNDVGASSNFVTISSSAFISLTDPPTGSLSWTPLEIYIDPGEFYSYWGVENVDVLILGQPTQVLLYDNEFVFRTIPNTGYTINIYGYKQHEDFDTEGNPNLKYDRWLRYVAYGAALNYGRDYRFADSVMASLQRDYAHEKKLMLTHTHNQISISRGVPSF